MRRTAIPSYFFRLAVILFAVMGAAACGAGPERDNELRIGVALEPPSLDPTSGAAAATDEIVYANIFEGLTRIGADGAVYPALAESWTVDPAGLVFTFTLREGVFFHDGTAFDAHDVRFSLDRARAPGSTNAQLALFAQIETVRVDAPFQVTVQLKERVADFLFNLAWGDAVIVAPETAAGNHSHPVGTGPFRFARWQKGQTVRVERFDDYWGAPVLLDAAEFRIIPDSAAAYAALVAGDVDGFPNFPAPELAPLLEKNNRFRLIAGVTEGETILAMNHARPPFDNIAVRRAIGHAIDREALIEGAMFGQGMPIGSFFSPLHPDYEDLTARSAYDPGKAKALLTAAGYANGFRTELKLPPVNYARRSGEIIAAQLAEIGVTVDIQYIEWAQWLDQVLGNRSYDMTIVSHTEPRDIGFFARDDNYFNYKSAAFNETMKGVDLALTPQARARLYKEAQRRLAEDAAVGFLFQLPKLGVWRTDVRGVWSDAPVQANDLTGVSIAPDGDV